MRKPGYGLAVLAALALVLNYAFFYNPQTVKQEEPFLVDDEVFFDGGSGQGQS